MEESKNLLDTLRTNLETSVNGYRDIFLMEYFNASIDGPSVESYWVADHVGGVLAVNDYFFNFDDIRYAVDNKVESSVLFRWYDYSLIVYDMSGMSEKVSLEQYVSGKLKYDEDIVIHYHCSIQELEQELTKVKEAVQNYFQR